MSKAEKKTDSLRQCIVTRDTLEKTDLIRFVLGPDESVIPDLKKRLPGRGVWVKANAKTLEIAIEKRLFDKAFKKKVKVEKDLINQIDDLLEKIALQGLSLSNKAGQIVCGFEKLSDALAKKDITALLHAHEASPDGREKLKKKWLNINGEEEKGKQIIDCFEIEQLSLALGQPNVVHAGLVNGGATEKLLGDIAFMKNA